MQAPRKNTLNLAAPATSRIRPRTVGGPAMQAPTSKKFKPRHKNTPNLSYYIVGAGLGSARVCRTLALAFCPAAYTEHPRPRRTRNPENTPPHRWRACNAGPYKQKASPAQKHPKPFLLYSRGEHCSPGCAERWLLRFAPQPTPNTPAHTAAANPQLLTPHS